MTSENVQKLLRKAKIDLVLLTIYDKELNRLKFELLPYRAFNQLFIVSKVDNFLKSVSYV